MFVNDKNVLVDELFLFKFICPFLKWMSSIPSNDQIFSSALSIKFYITPYLFDLSTL